MKFKYNKHFDDALTEELLKESIKVEPIVNRIVDLIDHNGFTNRSVSSTDATITMENKDGSKTTYTVRVKMIPQYILEEELSEAYSSIDKDAFIEETVNRIINH